MIEETGKVPTEPSLDDDRQQRYMKWKKNTKLLYDYLNTNSTKWPSLTCQFFPYLDTTTDTHRLLLSSFTSSQLPEDESLYIANISTLGHLNWSSLNNFDMDEMEFKPDNSTKLPPKNLVNEISIRFPGGDCNRARYMPQNPDVICAASSDGSVYVFDRTKHGTTLSQSATSKPYEIRLATSADVVQVDSTNEAVSLDWNRRKEGLVAACYSRGQVLIWDISQYSRSSPLIDTPRNSLEFDSQGANDVKWMPSHDSLLAACGESNSVSLYDTRTSTSICATSANAHHGGVNACDFNPHNDFLLASADGNGSLNLWDIRKLDRAPLRTLEQGSAVSAIQWNPILETLIAVAGQEDGLVKLWDASTGQLVFTHGGHMFGVNDIAWNAHDPYLMCSVSNDNSIHVWRPAKHLIEPSN